MQKLLCMSFNYFLLCRDLLAKENGVGVCRGLGRYGEGLRGP